MWNSGFRWLQASEFWSLVEFRVWCFAISSESGVRWNSRSGALDENLWGGRNFGVAFLTLVSQYLSVVIIHGCPECSAILFPLILQSKPQNLAKTSGRPLFVYTKWQWSINVHTSLFQQNNDCSQTWNHKHCSGTSQWFSVYPNLNQIQSACSTKMFYCVHYVPKKL